MRRLRKSRALSMILTVALLLGILPADMLGGIAGVQAAESAAAEGVGYTTSDWTVSSGDSNFEYRTTTWDFTTATLGSSATVANGDSVKGIEVVNQRVQMKSGGQGLSVQNDAIVQVPLDSETTEVAVTLQLTSNNANRFLVLGGNASQKVYHNSGHADKTEADGALVNKAFTGEYDSSYFSDGYFRISSKTTAEGDSGESKIGQLILTEQRVKAGSGDEEFITYDSVYNFCDGSIIPADTSLNGTGNVVSADGMLTVAPGAQNGYGYNGAQHGSVLKTGNTITIAVKGNAVIEIAGCNYSNDTATLELSKAGNVLDTKNTKTTGCYHNDASQVVTFNYEGEEGELVLTFAGGTTYVPQIKVTRTEPKPAVSEVQATVTVNNAQGILGEGDTVTLVNAADAADVHDITAASGTAFTLRSNTTYNIVSSKSGTKATAEGKTTITTGTEAVTVVVDVETTVVTLTPAIEGDELGTNVVYAVSNDDAVALTSGKAEVLPKNTKYSLEVRNEAGNVLEDWTATVDGADNFTTTAGETQAVTIQVKHVQDVKVTPVITGGSLLGKNKIYLENGTDSILMTDGEALTLKPNTEYAVVLKDASGVVSTDLEVTIDNKTTYTTGTADAEITVAVSTKSTRMTVYEFRDNAGKTKPVIGDILDGTATETSGILYKYGTGSGCSFDANQLRFRNATELWIPIQDDTTKITYAYTGNGNNAGRPTYLGSPDSTVTLPYDKVERSATLDDITDYIKVEGDQKYFPIYSGGDIKILEIKLIEYNPVNSVTVSGKIANAAVNGVKEVTFKNMDDENIALVTATIAADGTYSAVLRRVGGNTNYAASVSATGFKIDDANGADKFTLIGNEAAAIQNFEIVEAPVARVSGTVTGIPDSALKGALGVELVPDNPAISNIPLKLTKTGDGAYSFEGLVLDIDRSYTVELTNADDYEVKAVIKQGAASPSTIVIEATAKPVVNVTGNFVTSDDKAADVSKIIFTNMEDSAYSYTFDVTGGSYTAQLREAEYETSVVSASYAAFDHVSVLDAPVTNDVYLQGAADNSAVPYQAAVEVGAGKQFEKIADAVDYISRMERTSAQRVAIVLSAGEVYREQLVIDTPNITIQGNGATITWYYGVGFSYYSAKLSADGKSAYYDEAYAVDKYNKQTISQNPGHWGATVNLLAGAAGFTAEDVVFENSLNRYLTAEEIADGAAENVTAAVTDRTKAGIDVRAKAAKERACAIYIQADNTEYRNCKFLSSQDTIYTGDSVENSYFVDCTLEGTTDYICGDGNPVFDKCVLSMYSYSDQEAKGSYIVASKAKGAHGYLFNDCKIVTTSDEGLQPTSLNFLARAWDAGTVTFLNTEVESAAMIDPVAYKDMNAKVTDAHYYEYNTHTPDGTNVNTSQRAEGVTIMTAEQAGAVDLISYFDDWAPMYYAGELIIEMKQLVLDITAPVMEAERDNTVGCEAPGVVLGELTWYAGDKEFTGAAFESATEYKAVVTLSTAGARYKFSSDMQVTAEGGEAAAQVNADGTSVKVTVTYPKTAESGYYEVDLSQGLKKGVVYAGGISVLEDMAMKEVAGDTIGGTVYTCYVAGGNNPKTEGTNSAGNVPDSGSVLKLTAEKDGKLKIAMKINSGKTVYLVDEATNTAVAEHKNESSSSELTMISYNVEAGNTYYFYGNGTKVPMYAIVVDYREPEAWDSIAAPVLGDPVVDNKAGTITVPFTAQVGGTFADSIEVKMLSNGEVVDTVSYTAECSNGEVTLEPQASGAYSFQAVLRRTGMLGKNSNVTKSVDFILPMRTPVIINVENQGSGTIKFSWKEVPEAETYKVYLNGELKETVEKPYCRFSGLTVGTEYEFGVEAVRDSDVSPRATIKQTITAEAKKTWSYAAFGSGVDTKNNGYSGSIEGNDLALWSMAGKGKIVPASTDGLAYYYTTMDPETENFTLSADVVIDNWTYSNGQEGFGMMAADTVGEDGDSGVFWNNSYMASVTKVEYYWDKSIAAVSDAGDKYTMKLGVGSQEKIGVTKENLAAETTVSDFKSVMTTLETYCPANNLPSGTYNIADGYTNKDVEMGDVNLQKKFHMTIQRNNTGYFLSYTDESGVTTTKKYYHGDEGDELTKLDENNIYIGFFASRNAKVNIENVQLTTVKPEEDAPAEVRPITSVTPNYTIESASTANTADYELVYYGNADGTLTISTSEGAVIVSGQRVAAKTKFRVNTTLKNGLNQFTVEFTPDADYKPSKYEVLSSYDTKKFTFTVNYKTSALQNMYISPEGKADATGTRENPMDIYSAIKNAAPGQKLILMEGTYKLDRTVTIDRGIDGTEEQNIYMIADPEAASRPVLDFQRKCAGMVMAGDYWYFQGFDVTNSSNGQKGIQVSGSYNVLDNLYAYKNGNTGIQISRYKGTDLWEDWPSNNLILNCTSYLNADAGYEDADGFAAKLTIADGNVFDGCIAAYNADDGWDLFAKIESGPIGKVVIRNSVAFKNGYVIDANGNDVTAGNGNGFKLGGSSMSGYHTLENSIAFANKAKGIDSNSCPDIQVYNSTSYNNESFNVAFYTNDTKNTDFFAQGVLSFKDSNNVAEQIKLKGKQEESKVYGTTNYYFNGKKSVNTAAKQVTSSWFVNTDAQAAIHGGITRNADGTINMNGFLEPTNQVPDDTGARMSGSASEEITVTPDNKVETVNSVKAEISSTLPESVLTEEVKKATGCDSIEKLMNYLVNEIVGNKDADKVLAGVDKKNTSVLEVKIRVSFDGGVTWEDATEENFPATGIDLVLPYPSGTSMSENDFLIAHLVTLACNGAVPGSTEYYSPVKTAEGLRIRISSASPFIIGWVDIKDDTEDKDDPVVTEPEEEDDEEEVVDSKSEGTSDGRKSPKTLDDSRFAQTQSAKAELAQPDGMQEDAQKQAVEPVIVAAAPGAIAVNFNWWLILLAAIFGCAAAAVGVWNYRKSKEEEH